MSKMKCASDMEYKPALKIISSGELYLLEVRKVLDYSGQSAHALKRVQRTGIAV